MISVDYQNPEWDRPKGGVSPLNASIKSGDFPHFQQSGPCFYAILIMIIIYNIKQYFEICKLDIYLIWLFTAVINIAHPLQEVIKTQTIIT